MSKEGHEVDGWYFRGYSRIWIRRLMELGGGISETREQQRLEGQGVIKTG